MSPVLNVFRREPSLFIAGAVLRLGEARGPVIGCCDACTAPCRFFGLTPIFDDPEPEAATLGTRGLPALELAALPAGAAFAALVAGLVSCGFELFGICQSRKRNE